MIRESKLKAERRAKGLCIDCGGPRDEARYVRCKACRDVWAAYKKAWNDERQKSEEEKQADACKIAREAQRKAIERQLEADKRMRQANRCLRCEYSKFTGVSVTCPFPEGGCMKR